MKEFPAPSHAEIVEALCQPETYGPEVSSVQHIETHISHLFLTGSLAYKLKKPVSYGFLNYSTRERRKYFCEREVYLNQRYAPEIYQGVQALYWSNGRLRLTGEGNPCEYLVRMRQFDPDSLFLNLLEHGVLTRELLRKCVIAISVFHDNAQLRLSQSPHALQAAMHETLHVLAHSSNTQVVAYAHSIHARFNERYEAQQSCINERSRTSVKLLHGDLHLRNICVWNGEPCLFDGIEFNDDLATCDVWCDFAFLLMDLTYRAQPGLATFCMNTYLEQRDDYQGLAILPLALAYRAAVRAKVSSLEIASVATPSQKAHAKQSTLEHIALAHTFLDSHQPALFAIGGLSGSGKSTCARILAEKIRAVHIRSDVVRKHILGLRPTERAGNECYREEVTQQTYAGLLTRVAHALESGYHVILDAVYLSLKEREALEAWCAARRIPFHGFWCEVPLETALARVSARTNDASDADVTIVRQQYLRAPGPIHWHRIDGMRDPESNADAIAKVISE